MSKKGQAWRRARRRLSRFRPRPLVLLGVNAMSVSASKEKATSITHKAIGSRADLVFFCEAYKVDVPKVARPAYQGVQYLENAAMAGNAIAGRIGKATIKRPRIVLGSPATREGGGIRDRYILQARVKIDVGTPYRWTFRVAAGHVAPQRAPRAAARFVRKFKQGGGVKFADVNMDSTATKRRIGRKIRQVGVLAWSIPWWIPCSPARAVNVGGDHAAVEIILFPERKRKS